MYIATMYSYGRDANAVGVDGIVTCMGVFLSYNNWLYAIHVPDNSATTLALGRTAFVNFVQQCEPHFNGANAKLYAVLNTKYRQNADDEIRDYMAALHIAKADVIRVHKDLGASEAACIICEFVPGTTDCRFKYKANKDVAWTHNAATVRTGFYLNNSQDQVLSTTPALAQGWNLVDRSNSSFLGVHA